MVSERSLAQREHPQSARIAIIAILVMAILAVLFSFLVHKSDDELVNPLTKNELAEILQKPIPNVKLTYKISSGKQCRCKFFAQGTAYSQGKVLTNFVIFVYKDDQGIGKNNQSIPDAFQRRTIEAGGDYSNFVFALDRDVTLSFSSSLSASYYRFISTMQERLDSKTFSKYESGALPHGEAYVATVQENYIQPVFLPRDYSS